MEEYFMVGCRASELISRGGRWIKLVNKTVQHQERRETPISKSRLRNLALNGAGIETQVGVGVAQRVRVRD